MITPFIATFTTPPTRHTHPRVSPPPRPPYPFRSLAIIPGGFEEATLHCQGVDRVYMKKRWGLVKYALQNGYAMVPIFAFGERDTYSNLQVRPRAPGSRSEKYV